MELTNSIQDYMSEEETINLSLLEKVFKNFILILSPFAPFITEEMWERLGNKESVHIQNWPSYDEEVLKREIIELVVEVNGKVRGRIKINRDSNEKEIEKIILEDPKIKKHIENKKIKKVIHIKNKIINIVTE